MGPIKWLWVGQWGPSANTRYHWMCQIMQIWPIIKIKLIISQIYIRIPAAASLATTLIGPISGPVELKICRVTSSRTIKIWLGLVEDPISNLILWAPKKCTESILTEDKKILGAHRARNHRCTSIKWPQILINRGKIINFKMTKTCSKIICQVLAKTSIKTIIKMIKGILKEVSFHHKIKWYKIGMMDWCKINLGLNPVKMTDNRI